MKTNAPLLLMSAMLAVVVAIGISVPGCAPNAADNTTVAKGAKGVPSETAKPAIDAPHKASVASNGDPLRAKLEEAIDEVRGRTVYTTNGFWTIFHAILGLGPGIAVTDPRNGQQFNALELICSGNGMIEQTNFRQTEVGLDVLSGELHKAQGHQDQFLSEMYQWGVRPEQKLTVNGRQYTFWDFNKESLARTRIGKGQELSWLIIVVSQHYGTDYTWTNRFDETIHFEQAIQDELDASINDAACGGTHRLFGLTWAYFRHLEHLKKKGGKPSMLWQKVKQKLDDHVELARKHQNPADGMLSCNYFRAPGFSRDVELQLGAAGHIFEWLAQYASDDDLQKPWMKKAGGAVAQLILDNKAAPIKGGALYHAIHGLVTYHHRLYVLPPAKQAAAADRAAKPQ